jgi:hypothetical protein
MRSVRIKAKFFFLVLVLLGANSGYSASWCPDLVKTNTNAEAGLSKVGKDFWKIISFDWGNINFDDHLLKNIKVSAVKNQGVDGYFNPKVRVCDYEGDNCHELYNRTSCQKIYGTQGSGAGVSAAVFVDWEGTKEGDKLKNGMNWEWAEGVIDEEKVKFANSPKVCACSQKIACADNATKLFAGATSVSIDECDTCYQTTVKCAPVPLAPSPPPFCDQLAMSPPQVRIVPITNGKNDYFDPKVKVIIGDLIGKDGEIGEKLDFPRKYKKDKAEENPTPDEVREHSILDRNGTTHYFETYRKKNKLCTEYRGTEKEESQRRLQFPARCFSVPPAPEPKVVEVVNENTLKIEIEMSRENCMQQVNGSYRDSHCTFEISFDASEDRKKIDPRSFRVVKPKIVKKTTKNSNDESDITDVIQGILRKNPQFEILEKYGLTPNIGIEFPDDKDYSITNSTEGNKIESTKLELDDMGLPKIKVRYMRVKDQKNSKRKMLCLSGWKPEPEEFVLKRKNKKGKSKIISLKSMGAGYIKYNAVYSKESNQFHYLPSREGEEKKEIYVDILAKPQDKLNDIVFDKQGYVFFPDENKQEKGKCSYCVNENSKVNEAFQSGKGLKVVYKLIDGKREEKCEQGSKGCICFNGARSRSTQYLNKKNNKPFYLRYEEEDCKDKDGKTLKNEKGEIQKCMQLKDQLVKANRTEVFYADKLCRLDLADLKNRLREIIVKQLKDKKQKLEESNQGSYELGDGYTDDLSQYDYVEIEAWGGGEAGHIAGKAKSTESRPGMPGDYIEAKLKIDPSRPIIKVKVMEGGGGQENSPSNKDGGPTWIEMCNSYRQDCQPLITVAGGGKYRTYGGQSYKETKVHINDLKLGEPTIVTGTASTQDNQAAYIENGKIEPESISCANTFISNKPGAGGCIDKSKGSYSKGSPGYVKVKPMLDEFNEERVKKIDDAIEKMIQNPDDITGIDDSLINKLDKKIIDTIKEEIRKELLGL